MTQDFSLIIDRVNSVAKNMKEAAERLEYRAKCFEQKPDPEVVGDILNELLWITPNLGIQAVVNTAIRELLKPKE